MNTDERVQEVLIAHYRTAHAVHISARTKGDESMMQYTEACMATVMAIANDLELVLRLDIPPKKE